MRQQRREAQGVLKKVERLYGNGYQDGRQADKAGREKRKQAMRQAEGTGVQAMLRVLAETNRRQPEYGGPGVEREGGASGDNEPGEAVE